MEVFERFVTDIVEPTVQDFEAHRGSVRHAFLACVVVFHSIDYLAFDPQKLTRPPGTWGNLRKDYRKASQDFRLVDDVANAFKHAVNDRISRKLTADDVVGHKGAFSSGFSSGFDVDRVTIREDPDINLLETVKRAVAFLRGKSSGATTPNP